MTSVPEQAADIPKGGPDGASGTEGGGTCPLLAVIIPAYKGRHLARTLESFAVQTDRRFRVYVGDDASQEDLAAIVAPYRGRLDLVYRRFDENLGGTSLTRHWDRIISLGDEPWLWVFSDDDVVSPDCVEAFLRRPLAEGDLATLYRFQVTAIDVDGREAGEESNYPAYESGLEYTGRVLGAGTFVVLQNVIFSRAVYRGAGGFCDFPLGFGSDLASWARFARRGGLVALPEGRVFYRRHPDSICTQFYRGRGDRSGMLQGMRLTVLELRRVCAAQAQSGLIPARLELTFFCRQIRYLAEPLRPGEIALARRTLRELWPALPVARETRFWWHWMGPYLRTLSWYRWLAACRKPSIRP